MNFRFLLHSFLFSIPVFSPLVAEEPSEAKSIKVTLEDTKNFPGNWSLEPEAVFFALKYCTYNDTIKILEIGTGESTVQLTNLLNKKKIPFEYHVMENDSAYFKTIDGVINHYYELPELPWERVNEWKGHITQVEMPDFPVFDLIIVDGPHGVSRSEWYAKFKQNTRRGTVLLIDDFHHYKEFGEALNKNYIYTTVIEYDQQKVISGIEKVEKPIAKSFKVVKID